MTDEAFLQSRRSPSRPRLAFVRLLSTILSRPHRIFLPQADERIDLTALRPDGQDPPPVQDTTFQSLYDPANPTTTAEFAALSLSTATAVFVDSPGWPYASSFSVVGKSSGASSALGLGPSLFRLHLYNEKRFEGQQGRVNLLQRARGPLLANHNGGVERLAALLLTNKQSNVQRLRVNSAAPSK